MFAGISAEASNDSIGRLALLAGGSTEDAMEASGKAALDTAIAMGKSPPSIACIVHDAILAASMLRIGGTGGTGCVASRFRVYCLNNMNISDLEILFYNEYLLNFLKNDDVLLSNCTDLVFEGDTLGYTMGIMISTILEDIFQW